jgi:acetyl esterase/lipase
MLKMDAGFADRMKRLEREHRTLRHHNSQLFAQLTTIVKGAPVDRSELLAKLERYINGYRRHLAYESKEIFPMAKGTLSIAQLKKLEERTKYLQDPLFGDKIILRYHRLGRNLNLQAANLREEILTREFTAVERVLENLTRLADMAPRVRGLPAGLRRTKATPSWQARVMNGFTRRVMKPISRFGSVDSLRAITDRADEQGEKIVPADINAQLVERDDYRGEWVRIAGQRSRKVILYFPGGGFVIRTAVQHRVFVARICREARARALIVHYSLAPEIPFPGGLEDCIAAYHDLLRQGCKPENITIAGDSAGGGLVLSTLLALRDEGTALPSRAIVLSPLADLTGKGGSRQYNKHADPVLATGRESEMQELYIGDALRDNRYVSPIVADFDGLPPMLGMVGSTEILLDDTLRAAAQANKADVPFNLEVWEQMPHVFAFFSVLPESEVAIKRMARFISGEELEKLPERYGKHEITRDMVQSSAG